MASQAPQDWPEGFPVLPGGTYIAAPPAGSVKVSILAYPGVTPEALDAQLRAEFAKTGWTADPSRTGPEARRFRAKRGGQDVSVSIRADAGRAILQAMQL